MSDLDEYESLLKEQLRQLQMDYQRATEPIIAALAKIHSLRQPEAIPMFLTKTEIYLLSVLITIKLLESL